MKWLLLWSQTGSFRFICAALHISVCCLLVEVLTICDGNRVVLAWWTDRTIHLCSRQEGRSKQVRVVLRWLKKPFLTCSALSEACAANLCHCLTKRRIGGWDLAILLLVWYRLIPYCCVPPLQGLQVSVAWGHEWRAHPRGHHTIRLSQQL